MIKTKGSGVFTLESVTSRPGIDCTAEMEMGQWVMGHGSNGSPFLDGSRGSWVTASDPLTHDEITAQILNTITRLSTFVFLYDWTLFSVLCS